VDSTPRISLGYYPRDWQRQVHTKRKRFNVFALHRRAGKTEAAIMQLIDDAIQCTLDMASYAYVAPFLKQSKAIAWVRLKHKLRPLIDREAVDVNESELSVKFAHNGAVIRLFGADNADALRGLRLDGVVIDEVAQVAPEVWEQIIQPMLADRKGWAWFIGTPDGVNLFSELYYGAQKDPANWHTAVYTVYDTGAIDPEEVERLRKTMNPVAFAREFLCDFSAAGDAQLISLFDVITAQKRQAKPDDYRFAPKIIGVDPARFGRDRSVIAMRQGIHVPKPIVIPGIDNAALVDRIIEVKQSWGADAIFCDAGQGAGVIDWLRRLGHPCIEVWFGGKATKPQYHDKRTEIWCEMADAMPLLCIADSADYRKDLPTPTYEFSPTTGKKRLESKDSMHQRVSFSPDSGDALAVTWAQPVEAKSEKQKAFEALSVGVTTGVPEYDPFSGR
jgi:hypothetical protein